MFFIDVIHWVDSHIIHGTVEGEHFEGKDFDIVTVFSFWAFIMTVSERLWAVSVGIIWTVEISPGIFLSNLTFE
jgi:hypothetical protein